jgi:AcrR family transcriptional regulator
MNQVTAAPRRRAEQKEQTRQALLDAALRLMEDQSLSSLSLREVARAAGIVPAGFYRHFPDVDSLGVALVDESLEPLRAALRTVRAGLADSDEIIRRSLHTLARQVHAHRDLFRFIARERHGGVAPVRVAIRYQLRRFTEELAGDLRDGTVPTRGRLDRWPPRDVPMFAQLVVNHMVQTAAALLDVPARGASHSALLDTATAQLRLIVRGAQHWLDGR